MKKLLLAALLLTTLFNYSQTEWEVNRLSINTKDNDNAPAMYGADKLVFSSDVRGKLNLFIGDLVDGDVKSKKPFLKGETHEMGVTFTKDLQTMYFTRSIEGTENTVKKGRDKRKSLSIFKATRSGQGWSNIVSLPFNSETYDVAHPSLSSDGKKLYFSSNMPGTVGRSDIFVVDVLGNDTYSKPKNLGSKINTRASELYPFVVEGTLYFSSTGHNSLGGMDIFTVKLDGSSKVNRLSAPINSRYDDFSFTYSNNMKQGYFSSNRANGKGKDDLYRLQIKKKEVGKKRTCTQKVEGTVYVNGTQNRIENALVNLKDDNQKIIDTYQTNEAADYEFQVKCNIAYKIEATKQGFKTSEKIMKTNNQNGAIARKNIFLTAKGEVKPLDLTETVWGVYFEYNKVKLEKRNMYQLDKAIRMMKKNPKLYIHFESHTDSRAETDFNMELSEQRIEVLKEYVGFQGIFRKRFSGTAYGETKPINHCTKEVECTEAEYLVNRRTIFTLSEK